jgi:uncharacterized protein YqeY
MSLYSDIGDAWKEAMKARDKKKDVLSAIRSEVKSKVINTRSQAGTGGTIDAPDDIVKDVLRKMAKQRKESIEEYHKAARQDLEEKETFELAVIESYLPKAMGGDELRSLVKQALAEAGAVTAKDMGKAMKAAMAKVAGRAEGKDVQAAVKAALGG